MKTINKFLVLFLIAVAINAQTIPNGGFEQWSDGKPVKWACPNEENITPITMTNDKHSGLHAVKGQIIKMEFPGMPKMLLPAAIQSGEEGKGFPINFKPSIVSGYFKFVPRGGDKLTFGVVLLQNGIDVGHDALIIKDPITSFNQLILNIKDKFKNLTSQPDTIEISIAIIGPTTGQDFHEGTYFIVDDISIQ